ncbi:uncharacterized protein K452DRAFT_294018 [Aplosporella prunicola CBS 121167]|uniref:Palmitoyltransferase PFA4 n=1 Tax=Aplosporella prunicola CBS 121167 TaxID=1176127 RepID=A0A6A6BRM2_9PEZI|nr:uncharacterized protein K452DRAFT_294018 [Aplosporella prunicola CBS 121167]KAF2146438.1 hypothetical protein K452DRAFT_294018 [Aplosporella prunicola CBS 121167]
MASFAAQFQASSLAVPACVVLIAFLTSAQYLYEVIEPYPLSPRQNVVLNGLIACTVVSFARACRTDPGRVPKDWTPQPVAVHGETWRTSEPDRIPKDRQRWCSKCEAPKPPRAHHCKTCKRCIPKMDHHCPWLANCVSHTTYPHFIRVICYATAASAYNEHLLWMRAVVIWNNRYLPSYLGPTTFQLAHLFSLLVVNTLAFFAVSIMTLRYLKMFGENMTTIEYWEIERHETLLRRAKYLGGFLDKPDGTRVRIKKQEFPYDIGIWQNMKQAMGTGNVLAWLWPFSATPPNHTGLNFEVNGFEDPSVVWPPPDPDRMPRVRRQFLPEDAFTHGRPDASGGESIDVDAFRKRQEEDLKRWGGGLQKRQPFHKRYEAAERDDVPSRDEGDAGEEAWRNSEGERLGDFGVDEDAEFYDEDDVPLSELIRRKKEAAKSE